MATSPNEQDVLNREKQRFAAMVRKDVAFLSQVLADGLVCTHSGGNMDTEASFIDRLTSGRLAYEEAVPEGLRPRLFLVTWRC
jgi:ketosteroid isomerase-like protein